MKYVGKVQSRVNSEVVAIASGALPSGQPVVVNADGTVSVISQTSSSESLGSDVTMNNANTSFIDNTFDSTNNKVVIAYRDGGNSNYGTTRLGTVDSSDNSISFTVSEFVFSSSATQYISACFDSANGKVVIAYQDQGDSFKGKAIVGTISGSSITFGSSVQFQSGETTWINAVYDTSTSKVVIIYRDSSGNGKGIVGTVSGTSISFGSAVSTGHGAIQGHAVYHAAASRVVAAGKVNNSTASAVVGAVSGTSISFGTAISYGTGSAQKNNNRMGYDSASEKVVIFFRDEGFSNYGRAVVGTVDASDNSISFANTGVTVTTDTVDKVGVQGFSSGGQIIFTYSDTSNTKGDLRVGTISGTTLSVGSEVQVTTVNPSRWGLCEDTTNDRVVVAYDRSGDSIANVYNPDFSVSNLTSENYIGISQGDVVYNSATQAVGDTSVFKSGSTTGFAAAFDTSTGKVVVAFSDGTDGQKGKAVVGTVNAANNSISFGTAVTFQNSEITGDQMDCIFDSSNNKVVIFYTDTNNPSTNDRTGTAIVGTVSGTSISFGTKAAFESGNTQFINACFDSNLNKFVVAYKDADNSDVGTSAVGTVSGTDISFGTPVVFNSANTNNIAIDFDSSNNKVVIAYRDQGASQQVTAIVGTVSGTSISYGSEVVVSSSSATQCDIIFDSSNNKMVVVYQDSGDADKGKAHVGTVSGTSISFGSAVTFNTGASEYHRGVFDSNAGKILIVYKDGGNSNRPTIVVGTVSGTSISFGSEVVVMDVEGITIFPGVAFDSTNNKVVMAYIDTTGSDNAIAQVVQVAFDNTTRGSVADGNTVAISAAGSVAKNQNALTAGQEFFVQNDGTLSLTADSPSVSAGIAVSATELIVKGK